MPKSQNSRDSSVDVDGAKNKRKRDQQKTKKNTEVNHYLEATNTIKWLKATFNMDSIKRLLKAETTKSVLDHMEELTNSVFGMASESNEYAARLDESRQASKNTLKKLSNALAEKEVTAEEIVL